MTLVTRRRMISLVAAFAGAPRAAFAAEPARWRGVVLGGLASLDVYGPAGLVGEVIREAVAEARRLERIFSLYDVDSDVARLNAQGVLVAPPPELLDLLECSAWARRGTAGVFDPTVQPLWELYYRHFAQPQADPEGPSAAARAAALARVGFDKVSWSRDRIALASGTKLTFNGVAQGYLSDRVALALKARGFDSCMIDMGEPRVLGAKPDGSAWRIGVGEGSGFRRIEIRDGAVATTRPSAYVFGTGKATHLFHPVAGASPSAVRSISVAAPDATTADALSTGLALHEPQRIAELIAAIPQARIVALET